VSEFDETSANAGAARIEQFLDLPVDLTVELGRARLSLGTLMQLGRGSMVSLDTLAGEPVNVLVNDAPVAQGEVVVTDGRLGVRLTDILTPEERLRRLRG
jgi:flagellar motor switch protein FliN